MLEDYAYQFCPTEDHDWVQVGPSGRFMRTECSICGQTFGEK